MSRSWKAGSTSRWRRIRAHVLARDNYRCTIALPGTWTTSRGHTTHCQGTADCVHHTRGKQHGDDPRYLAAACTPCNLKVGDPTKTADPAPQPRTNW